MFPVPHDTGLMTDHIKAIYCIIPEIMNFDQKAKEWDKDPQRVERAKVFALEIINFLNGKKLNSALEFGSGTGLVSFQLRDRFKAITLVDNSAGMTEVLSEKIRREKIPNMKPLLMDIYKDNLAISGFDIIYTLLTLHHVKDVTKTFEIFNKMLVRGGYICIGDLITEDGSFHSGDPEFDGHKGFDTVELKKLLELNGFTTEHEKIFSVIEREHHQEIKKYPLFLIIGKKAI
jgi:SAM-dependent methyltransferase